MAKLFLPELFLIAKPVVQKGMVSLKMPNEQEGNAAIAALNGSDHMGRTINVAIANDRPAREVEE